MEVSFHDGFGVFSMASSQPIAIFEYELAANEFIEFNHLENCAEVQKGKFTFIKTKD